MSNAAAAMSQDLQGKVAFVTGAGGGMGSVIAERLAAAGATVALGDIKVETAVTVADRIKAKGGVAEVFGGDISSADEVREMAATLKSLYGRCDILVNAAGVLPPATPLENHDVDLWDRVLAVNLRGVFLTTRYFGAAMLEAGSGSIINIASIAIDTPNGVACYSAGKAAIKALSRQTAVEWGARGVRANSLSPGMIRTPMTANVHADEGAQKRRRAAIALGRIGEPEEVADVVLWLAGDGSRYITGQDIVVDGGFQANALLNLLNQK